MQELPEDNLDGLFRKSAEEFEPTFEPADWTAMKAKLDENDRSAFWGKWFKRSLIGLGVVLVIGVSWYSWQVMNAGGASTRLRSGLPAGARPSVKTSATDKPAETGQNSGKPSEKAASGEQPSSEKPAIRQPDASKAVVNPVLDQSTAHTSTEPESKQPTNKVADNSERRKRLSSERLSDQQAANSNPSLTRPAKIPIESVVTGKRSGHTKSVADLQPSNQPSTSSKAIGATENQSPVTSISTRRMTNPDAVPATANVENADVVTAEPVSETERLSWTIDPLPSRSMKWPVFEVLDQQVAYIPEKETRPSIKATPKVTGLSVRAVVAPDLTTIGLKNFTKPGSLYGLSVEYRFTRRLSILAGGLWNKKVYSASGSEYKWPWPNRPVPTEVEGACKMIDIPVAIRYDFLHVLRKSGNEARGFVTVGVTGFKILKEKYDYSYAPGTQHVYYWAWEGASGWGGVSHLNLSVGYEHSLTRRLAWQVEPFMKMPLKGVGFFKMNLITTGAFLSLRYKL